MNERPCGKAKRVRIYLDEDDRAGHVPAHRAVVDLLRRENAQGATVLRGQEGFGASGQLRVPHLADVAQRLPLVVEWIDRAELVERLLPRIQQLVPRSLVTLDDTEVVLWPPRRVRDLAATLTAGEVMSREVVSISRETPVRQAVELMLRTGHRSVPVVEDGRPVGLITNTDLVWRGGLGVRVDLLRSLDQPEIHGILERLAQVNKVAADAMTPAPVTVSVETPLPKVAEILIRRRLKRLPVVDRAGALVGMLSRVDLLRTVAGGLGGSEPAPRELGLAGDLPLSQIMRRDIPMVRLDTPLPEVFRIVASTRLNRALVVDGDRRVVGLVTDAELLERVTPALRPSVLRTLMGRLPFTHPKGDDAAAARHARAQDAADLMSRGVPQAREDTLLSQAIAVMLQGDQKVLAVTDADGRLAGIVDRADLLRGLLPPRAGPEIPA